MIGAQSRAKELLGWCNVTTAAGQPYLGDDCSPEVFATFSSCCLLPTAWPAWCVLVFYSVRPCGMTPLADWLPGHISLFRDCRKAFKYLVFSPHSLTLVNPLSLTFSLADPAELLTTRGWVFVPRTCCSPHISDLPGTSHGCLRPQLYQPTSQLFVKLKGALPSTRCIKQATSISSAASPP